MSKNTQRSFASGEVSEDVAARADLQFYSSALSTCKNAYIRAQGGVYNREGTYYIGDVTGFPNGEARLMGFTFGSGQSYIIVVGVKIIQIIYNDAFLIDPATGRALTIITPFADLASISRTVYSDTVTIVDGVVPPQVLKRYGHTDWRLEAIDFSTPIPKPSDVELIPTVLLPKNTQYDYAVTAIDGDGAESLPTFKSIETRNQGIEQDGKNTIEIFCTLTGHNIQEFNIYKAISASSGIYGFIGRCNNDFEAEGKPIRGKFIDANYAPDLTISPPKDNDPFKGEKDRPQVCGFYQQRRIFASTTNNPQKIFCTETGRINSMRFSKPGKATDAIIQEVVSSQVNSFRHIVTLGGLILLTAEGEMKVTEGSDFVLTPTTFGQKTISNFGASKVVPARAGNTVIFSQDQGARLIGLNIDPQSIAFSSEILGNDISIRAEHIFKGRKIVDMSYCKEPYGIIWCVLDNGKMAGLTYDFSQKVWGFHRHETKGRYISSATIPHSNLSATYFAVSRNIGGTNRLYIERLVERKDDNIEDCFFVDCGLTYNGSPATTISGLRHLAGQPVSILADGVPITGKTVSNGGDIVLDKAASKVHVGLSYDTEIVTLPIDSPARSYSGETKTINQVYMDIYRTDSLSVAAVPNGINRYEDDSSISMSFDDDELGVSTLQTGEKQIAVNGLATNHGKLSIKHDSPLPFGLLKITTDFNSTS